MAEKRTEFEAGGHKLAIIKPTAQQNEDATMEYNRVFSKALNSGALLREKLEFHMRQQSLWDDTKEKEYNDEMNNHLFLFILLWGGNNSASNSAFILW